MKEVEAKTETFTPQIHKLAPEEHENINGWMKNGREKGKQIRGTLWCESDFQTDEQWRTLGVKCWVGGGGVALAWRDSSVVWKGAPLKKS